MVKPPMLPKHRAVVEAMTARYERDPDVLALIVISSVARGEAHEHSNVDAMVVLSDEAYARNRIDTKSPLTVAELSGEAGDPTTAAVVDMHYLRAAAERGPEPTRYAFVKTLVPFCRDPQIDALLAAIPVYPEHERAETLASFASQLPMHLAYLYLGDYSENPYILVDTAHELALFGDD